MPISKMRRIARWIFTIMIFAVFLSCENRNTMVEFVLKPTNEIVSIELDSLTSNVSEWLDYYYDEKADSGLLFSIDRSSNELELYSLGERRLVKKVKYDREGPNGVGNLTAGAIVGLDSVLLFPPFNNSIIKSNVNDSAVDWMYFQKPDDYSAVRSETSYFRSVPTIKGGYLYTKTLFGGNYLFLENDELSTKPLMYRVNLENGEVEFPAFTFPDDYWLKGKRHFEFSNVLANDQFVFSFHSDHNIYFGDSFEQPLKKTLAKSRFLPNEFENLPLTGDRNDRRRYFATTPHYGNLIFDQFRKVYYRFCYPKVELEGREDMRMLTLFPKEFSIMILDEEFKIIGETLFNNDSEFAVGNVFIGSEGLFVSVNHPDSEFNKEDKFSFRLLKLVRNVEEN